MPADRPILAEGHAAIPQNVHVCAEKENCLWFSPSEELIRKYHPGRPFVEQALAAAAHPQELIDNWLQTDLYTGERLVQSTEKYGFSTLRTGLDKSLDQLADETASFFGHFNG